MKKAKKSILSNPTIMLIFSIILLSFSPLFIHWADAPGIVASFYRMTIAFFFLAPFYFKFAKSKPFINHPKPGKFQILLPIGAGVLSALDHSFWSSALKQTSVANATLLNYISPLWVSIIAILILKENYKGRYWLGLLCVFLGTASVLNLSNENLTFKLAGEGFAIISSVFYAGYFLISQKSRGVFTTFQHLFISLFSCCITLGLIILMSGLPIVGYSRLTFLMFFMSGLISQLLGYYCLSYALGKIPASIVSPSLALQPVITAILAIPLAKQSLSLPQIIGGILVIAGIVIINLSKNYASSPIDDE